MIPLPYLIHIVREWMKKVLNNRIMIRDAHSDGMAQCFGVLRYYILRNIFGGACGEYPEMAVHIICFEV